MAAKIYRKATIFSFVDHRGQAQRFTMFQKDRRYHTYLIGKTGVGKTTLLRTLLAQDIARGNGAVLFDPHGDLAEEVVKLVPLWREDDLIYLDPDTRWHFNPLRGISEEHRPLAAAGIVDVFKKSWSEGWGPRLEHVLRNVVFTLLEREGSTFADIPRLLTEKSFREDVVRGVENAQVRRFWQYEFGKYSTGFSAVVSAPVLNKVGAFLTDPRVREILCGEGVGLNLREIIDGRKLLIVNLAKGKLGEGPSSLLGSLLLSHLALAGLERADMPESKRQDCFVYLDEFQSFATLSVATMLSELRKYRLNLILAHQYLGQLSPEIADAVIGNVGTLICFRLGAKDAPLFARELAPKFEAEDLVNLPNYHIYLRLMINGQVSKPFSAVTIGSLEEIPGLEAMLGREAA
ncbi:MAG: type IV secretion system DNA-binding domain-containing protein [Acidobacteriota bacterium]|nr:type IV secretion system DNA-binding domain-containing protein [Acidobacteriota bacterium]